MFSFSDRCVGVELEIPEDCPTLRRRMEDREWSIHDDGSIPDDGNEYVSPKMQGDTIREDVTEFYRIAADREIRTEHQTCGVHCHIDARDIFRAINAATDGQRTRVIEDRVKEWGMAVSALSRLFVGPSRNGTRFASGGFAIRGSYNCDPIALKKSRRVEYPTVAIREETFEFRLYPSTSVANYTLARVAWSQACVDWLHRRLDQSERSWKASLRRFTKPLENYAALQDLSVLTPLWDEIKLCEDARTVLLSIATKFQVPNRSVLPGIWQRERDAIMEQEAHARAISTAMVDSVARYAPPSRLIRALRDAVPALILDLPLPAGEADNLEEAAAPVRRAPVRQNRPASYSGDQVAQYCVDDDMIIDEVADMAVLQEVAAVEAEAEQLSLMRTMGYGSLTVNNDTVGFCGSMIANGTIRSNMFAIAANPQMMQVDELVTRAARGDEFGVDEEDRCDCDECLELRRQMDGVNRERSRMRRMFAPDPR